MAQPTRAAIMVRIPFMDVDAMQDTGLIVEDQGAVRTLRLHRPAVHNAFDATLIGALTDALQQAGRAAQIRVVVITGAGAAFSAGAT
ncbi:hypothetical protein XPR_1729 [Xanthomonas arboricola pv. pruni MAFF 301420]|uniref:Enoyl-CoA hydratase n=1 Tax=Xanthomonas arboricola pv. pruni MAFF 301420 TaxID=1418095 RepID=W4SGM4_9XANT|nr:hypothetical protein XPR_1729 [Xanthomonas arboricola pv. pruni MAFF 301420]